VKNFTLRVNGHDRRVNAEPDTPLLYVLRNDLDLKGPRFGCGLGQCGACSVIIDGKATRSCITPLFTAGRKTVTTLEGLGSSRRPHRIQQAFIDAQAAQCGYCINGMIMTAEAFLDRHPRPSEDEVRGALAATDRGGAGAVRAFYTQGLQVCRRMARDRRQRPRNRL
jgi:nicotinate dehydrogenase subunit A